MLLQRVITAIILLLGLVAITAWLSPFYFAIAIAIIVLLAAWEWSTLIGLNRTQSRWGFLLTVALMQVALFLLFSLRPETQALDPVRLLPLLILGLLFWLLSISLLRGFPNASLRWNDPSRIAIMGLFAMLPTWAGVVQLKMMDPNGLLVIGLVVLVAAADIGAYFAGIKFGANKLAPELSPKKTWEGVWGGMALTLVAAGVLAFFIDTYVTALNPIEFVAVIIVGAISAAFSVVGDLVESMLKRNQTMKDSGSLLPGHGGLLDRIDGLMAATPVFVLLMMVVLGPNLGD